MMKILLILFLLYGLGLPAPAQNRKKRGTAAEFSAMSREIRVTRSARERLEDNARLLEYAVKHEQLTPAEIRKVQSILDRVDKMLEKARKNGKMSVSEAQTLDRELSRAYRTIWFLRRNQFGKGQKIVFLGRQIYLREEYWKKLNAGSLNQKEMKEIMRCYYSASRIRERVREDGMDPARRAALEKECFETLSEYFTLTPPPEEPPKPAEGK